MYNTLSVSTQQHPLIPLDPPNLSVSSATAQTMRMMLETGVPPQAISGLLRAAGFSDTHTRYLGGPIILPDSVWSDSLPNWLSPAVYGDRLYAVITEHSAGIVGDLATPAEVLAYLYPLTMDAPLPEDLRQLYLWAGQEVVPRHSQTGRANFLGRVNGGQPVVLTVYERARLRRLQYDIRRRVIAAAVEPALPALPSPNLFPPSAQYTIEGVL